MAEQARVLQLDLAQLQEVVMTECVPAEGWRVAMVVPAVKATTDNTARGISTERVVSWLVVLER